MKWLLVVLLGFGLTGCGRNSEQSTQQTQITTSSKLEQVKQVKLTTGIDLPKESTLIAFGPAPHSDVDMWLLKLDGTNVARYPGQLTKLFVGSNAVSQAELLEREGHISIKNPTACYFGIWDWKGLQIHATLISTEADGSYVMIDRFNVNVQGGQSPATNK